RRGTLLLREGCDAARVLVREDPRRRRGAALPRAQGEARSGRCPADRSRPPADRGARARDRPRHHALVSKAERLRERAVEARSGRRGATPNAAVPPRRSGPRARSAAFRLAEKPGFRLISSRRSGPKRVLAPSALAPRTAR